MKWMASATLAAIALATGTAFAERAAPATDAASASAPFTFEEVMVPMRDGARLQTVIIRPAGTTAKLPILLQRTPYGVPDKAPGPEFATGGNKALVRDGYVFVWRSTA